MYKRNLEESLQEVILLRQKVVSCSSPEWFPDDSCDFSVFSFSLRSTKYIRS